MIVQQPCECGHSNMAHDPQCYHCGCLQFKRWKLNGKGNGKLNKVFKNKGYLVKEHPFGIVTKKKD
jgi:hypothetical protein